jgi:hypothetical protein
MPFTIIDDSDPTGHGATVESYFLNDAPSGWTTDVRNRNPADVVDEAIAEGAVMIIRSMTGLWAHMGQWDRATENGVIVVHAHGSNSNVRLSDPPDLDSAVAVGGEDPADGSLEDDRSYGPGLEVDAIAHDGATAQSWATPTVAAVLAHLYDEHGSWRDARWVLRQMALANNPEGEWSEERGFGFVYSINHPDSNFSQRPRLAPGDPVDNSAINIEGRARGGATITWSPSPDADEQDVYIGTQFPPQTLVLTGAPASVSQATRKGFARSGQTIYYRIVSRNTTTGAEAEIAGTVGTVAGRELAEPEGQILYT